MGISIKEFQDAIMRAYYDRDSKRGLDRTFMWFIEEVGELARAIKNGERNNLEEEIADVFAWLVSLANLLNVDLERAVLGKYGHVL